jgi:hypothetical protein
MPVRRVLLAALAVVAIAALVPAVSASAAGGAKTKIVVSLKFPAFHGSLQSSKAACTQNRTVKLYREKSGSTKLLGSAKSSAKGKWSIPIGKRLTSGAYYARVFTTPACKASKSKVNTVD